MKTVNPIYRITIALLIWALPFTLPLPAQAQIPQLVRYQGTLTDTEGIPLDGEHTLTFRFYDDEAGGSLMWEETQWEIPVNQGAFSVLLGQNTPLTLGFDFNCWLGVSVDGSSELAPRHQVASVPNAYLSDRAEKLYNSQTVQSGNLLKNGSFESWGSGESAAPEAWSLSGIGATVTKNSSEVRMGKAALDLMNLPTNAASISQTVLTISATKNTQYRGKIVTASVWAKTDMPETVSMEINDGRGVSTSDFHPGDGTWQLLSVTHTLDETSYQLAVTLKSEAFYPGTTTFDGAGLMEGMMPFAFHRNMNDEFARISCYKEAIGVQQWANRFDRGVWRMEIGQVTHTMSSGGGEATGVPFGTAFKRVHVAFVTGDNTGNWYISQLNPSGMTIRVDGSCPNETVTGYWVVIGQE